LYNSLLVELSEVYVIVCNDGNCWDVAANAGAFPADALIDDIRVSICIDNALTTTNPLLTVRPIAPTPLRTHSKTADQPARSLEACMLL